MKVLVAQSCPTFCDPVGYSPPGSSVHGILQAGILMWVAMPFFRGSSQPRDRSWVSCTAGRFLTRHFSGGRFLHFLQPQFPYFQGSMNSTLGQGNMFRVLVPPDPDDLHLQSLMTGLGIIAAKVFSFFLIVTVGFPGGASGKEPACKCRRHKRCGFDPLGGYSP